MLKIFYDLPLLTWIWENGQWHFLEKKKSKMNITDLGVEKASEESTLYTHCSVYAKDAVKMLKCFCMIGW